MKHIEEIITLLLSDIKRKEIEVDVYYDLIPTKKHKQICFKGEAIKESIETVNIHLIINYQPHDLPWLIALVDAYKKYIPEVIISFGKAPENFRRW